jgi:hypothetical protein
LLQLLAQLRIGHINDYDRSHPVIARWSACSTDHHQDVDVVS